MGFVHAYIENQPRQFSVATIWFPVSHRAWIYQDHGQVSIMLCGGGGCLKVVNVLDKEGVLDIAFLFWATYSSTHNDLIRKKLYKLGFNPWLVPWICIWIKGRYQSIVLGGGTFGTVRDHSIVLVLGIFLFSLFVSDITEGTVGKVCIFCW